jgi:endonuclease/exonuclease/phosphatase family metal-dependent hydrolase
VLLVFGLGYLAAYLPPETFWWTGPFAVVLPWTAIGAALVALGFAAAAWTHRRGAPALVAGLVIVALWGRFGGALQSGGEAADASSDTLTLLTFNVPQARAAPSLASLVASTDADLVALQELDYWVERGATPLRRLPSSLRAVIDAGGYRVPPAPPDARVQQPILSRVAVDSLRMTPLPGPGAPCVTRVRFTWQGRSAVLYNLHLNSVSRVKPWQASADRMDEWAFWRAAVADYRDGAWVRVTQARSIRRMIDRETLPVIVAGDFNSTPHDWAYHHLAAGLQDAYAVHGLVGGGTYPSDGPLVRIDHVLVSDAFEPVDAQILEARPSSDHRPVIVRLRWVDDDGRPSADGG